MDVTAPDRLGRYLDRYREPPRPRVSSPRRRNDGPLDVATAPIDYTLIEEFRGRHRELYLSRVTYAFFSTYVPTPPTILREIQQWTQNEHLRLIPRSSTGVQEGIDRFCTDVQHLSSGAVNQGVTTTDRLCRAAAAEQWHQSCSGVRSGQTSVRLPSAMAPPSGRPATLLVGVDRVTLASLVAPDVELQSEAINRGRQALDFRDFAKACEDFEVQDYLPFQPTQRITPIEDSVVESLVVLARRPQACAKHSRRSWNIRGRR